MVNGFQEGAAERRSEKLPAFVILTPRGTQETTIKHPVARLTCADSTDMEGPRSDMDGGVCCILGLAGL